MTKPVCYHYTTPAYAIKSASELTTKGEPPTKDKGKKPNRAGAAGQWCCPARSHCRKSTGNAVPTHAARCAPAYQRLHRCRIIRTLEKMPGDLQTVRTAVVGQLQVNDRLAAVQVFNPVNLIFQILKL